MNKQRRKKKLIPQTLSDLIKKKSDEWRQMSTGKKGDRIDYYGLYFWHDLESEHFRTMPSGSFLT